MEAKFTTTINGLGVTLSRDDLETPADVESWMTSFRSAPEGDGESEVIVPRPARPWGVMDIGEVTAKRGKSVTVPIFGSTDAPVKGFIAAVGYESNHFALEGGQCGSFLHDHGRKGTDVIRDRPRGHPRVGSAGAFVLVYCGGWTMNVPVTTPPDSADPDTDDVTAISPSLIIPPETIIAELEFYVKDEAPIGAHPLLLRTNLFGKMPTRILYTSMESAGLYPELADGSITVE